MADHSVMDIPFGKIFLDHPAIMFLIDPVSGAFIDANKSAEAFYGYSREEFRRMTVREINTLPVNLVEQELRNTQNGNVTYLNFEHRLANGLLRVVEVYTSLIRLQNRNLLFSIVHDITERKQAEDRLRESEVNYRNIFNSVSDAIYIQDEQGYFLDVNEGAIKMYGHEKDFFIGKTPESISAPGKNDMPAVIEAVKRAFAGDVQVFKYWGLRKNGEIFPKEVKLFPGKFNNQEVVIAFAQDITEREHSELIRKMQYKIANAMVNSRNLYELFGSVRNELSELIDTTNFFIAFYQQETGMLTSPFEMDENDSIPSWPAEKSLTGYVIRHKKSFLISKKNYFDLVNSGEIDVIGTPAEQWLGVPLIIDERVIGAIVIQSYSNKNTFDQNSVEILEIVANQLSSYIERKRAEVNALKLSKAIDQSPVSIVITDSKGAVEYVNPKFTEVTGYTVNEVLGRNQRMLKSGEHDSDFYRELWETILSGRDWHGEFLNKNKDGKLYWESTIISPVNDEEGKITHFVAVKEDISEKKRIMEDLIAAKEKAEESDRLKSSFLANVSHEIRTPMNAIIGFSSFLNEPTVDPDKIHFYTQIIQKQAYSLLAIIEDILDISKIEAGQMRMVESDGDIRELLLDIFNTYDATRQDNGKAGIHFLINNRLKEEENLVSTDFKWLKQILTNLAGNAFKFTSSGHITIGCRRAGQAMLEFFVEDSGIGIAPEKQEIIFERFRQADEAKNREYGGTGLGLAISRGLVELLGGKLTIHSQPGAGSTFSFTVPFKPVMTHSKPVAIQGNKTYDWSGKRLLIVEDDAFNIDYLRLALAETAIEIDHARLGLDAIAKADEKGKYSLVLLDIRLPDIEGFEVARQLLLKEGSLPIIAQTAYASENYRKLCMEAGCVDYISKPIQHKLLLSKMSRFLDK